MMEETDATEILIETRKSNKRNQSDIFEGPPNVNE